jgi:hypothetical protein
MKRSIVLGMAMSGLVIFSGGCGRPAYRVPAPAYSPPDQRVSLVPDSTESKPHMTVRIIRTVPPTYPAGGIDVARTMIVKSTYIGPYTGWSTSQQTISTAKGALVVLHRDIQFSFALSPLDLTSVDPTDKASSVPLGLSLTVRNGSNSAVVIDWNAASIIGRDSATHPIIHRGMKFSERSAVVAPSTIPPGALLDDFVYPRDLISYVSGRCGGWAGVNYFRGDEAQGHVHVVLADQARQRARRVSGDFRGGDPGRSSLTTAVYTT